MKFFYFLKIIFDISTSKRYENIKKKIHFKQKKKISKDVCGETIKATLVHYLSKRAEIMF